MPKGTAKRPKPGAAPKKRAAVSAKKDVPAPAAAPAPSPAPAKPQQPGAAIPRVRENAYYHSAIVFGLGVVAVAVLLFAIVRDINVNRMPPPAPPQAEEDDPLFADVRKNADFKSWIATWRGIDPYVSVAEFTRTQSGAIRTTGTPDMAVTPSPEQLGKPLADRYVWSPARSRFIDYLASFGEPDSSVQAFNRDGKGKIETLAYCGTPCRFEGAFWLDEDRAVVLGIELAAKADGSPLCLPPAADGQGDAKCYQRLNATVYDFARGTQATYRSETHLFASQPFGRAMSERWAAGLAPEERAALGLDVGGDVELVSGVISDVADDARILTLSGGKIPRIVTVADKAPIRDPQGKALPFSALREGLSVEAQAVERPDGSVVAAAIRVIRMPAIFVSAPADGASVGSKFAVKGEARVFEGNVRVRVTNGRTGKKVIDAFTTAAAAEPGTYASFAYAAALPSGAARTGDSLSLEVFGDSAADGSEVDKVIILLTFKP